MRKCNIIGLLSKDKRFDHKAYSVFKIQCKYLRPLDFEVGKNVHLAPGNL